MKLRQFAASLREWFICKTHPSYYNHVTAMSALHCAHAHNVGGFAESCPRCGGYHIFWDQKPLNQRRMFWFMVTMAMFCFMTLAAWIAQGTLGFILWIIGGFSAAALAVYWQYGRLR